MGLAMDRRQGRPGRALDLSFALGLILLSVYALALFFPPAAQQANPTLPDASLLERLFPGVPGWWVVGRLLALAMGATLLAARVRAPLGTQADLRKAGPQLSSRRLHLSLAMALLLFASAFWAERFSRPLQIAYVTALWLPVMMLGFGSHPGASPREPRPPLVSGATWRLAAVIALWLLWRGFESWHCLRGADAVDTWEGLESLEEALQHGRNLLTSSRFLLMPDANLFAQGLLLVDLGLLPLGAGLVQAFQLLWLAVSVACVGLLAARRVSPAAGPVASAVLLFSPFSLMIPIQTAPFSLGPPFAAGALLALDSALHRRSGAALVALALLLGLSPWHPPVIPLAALSCGVALVFGVPRFPRRSILLVIGLLVFVAAVLPGWRNRVSPQSFFSDVTQQYGSGRISWSAGEWLLLGQASLSDTPLFVEAGRSAPFDVPLGSLLAPFAIPRTPLRLLGDSLLDPVGAALAACGLVLCLLRARRRRSAAFLLAALGATLVTGFLSSYDRPSLTRLSALPVVMALLAAVGFEAVRRRLRSPAAAASVVVTSAIIVTGTLLFDVVNPRILPRSALGIALDRLDESPPKGDAVLLRPDVPHEVGWRHLERIAAQLPPSPIPVWSDARLEGLADLGSEPSVPELLFWSPRLEADAEVSRRICRLWPNAAIYVLRDSSGLSTALAARPRGPGWDPGLLEERWRLMPCKEGTAWGASGAKVAQAPGSVVQ
jgi:hypothetical protein